MFRFNPAAKAEGKNPFTLDSKAPSTSYVDFIKSENRYARLVQTNPDKAEVLFAQGEANAKAKYERLQKMVDLYSPEE